jgi:2-oxoisovalerate dehydrogenase E2 component (dihydrolipoyl transacylase)
MKAIVLAIADHPEMNTRYDDDAGVAHRHHDVHIGIAAQTDTGLVVPVVADAHTRSIWGNAAEILRLAETVRSGSVDPAELQGSTISITSLGPLGGIVTTPLINAPEVAIVGVNKIVTRPVYVDGQLIARKMMNLSSSFDHRLIDGADAAGFIGQIRDLMQQPALLFADRR